MPSINECVMLATLLLGQTTRKSICTTRGTAVISDDGMEIIYV